MESGQVESKSLTQTKGRIPTITGQFFGLMEAILPLSSNESFKIEELFSLKKIKVYLKFLEDLSREPCTIRNSVLTLKHILKQFLSSSTFQLHQRKIQETCQFLDQESSRRKMQEFNKVRPNSEELLESGHFMDEEEFSLLIMDLLQQTRCLTQQLQQYRVKSIQNVLPLQYLCYTLMSLLDGGLRREVVARLQIDSLIQKNGQFFLKKLVEKRNRGNTHEVPLLEISGFLFLLWKRERKALLEQYRKKEDTIMSLWITPHLQPARPDTMVDKMKLLIQEFNPCLQMNKLDLRRWRISSVFERHESQLGSNLSETMSADLVLMANYLNTSLNCIRNHYNRHCSSNAQKGLNLLQPINAQMNRAFSEFQESGVLGREERSNQQKASPVALRRYVRRTLDRKIHEQEFEAWKQKFEKEQQQNTHVPSFEELYERFAQKRTRDESMEIIE